MPGSVTIATNMAGRGTDIVLGGNLEAEIAQLTDPTEAQIAEITEQQKARQQAVKDAGGLHIIGTERHESRRIDNQLRGRAGRQGDPGSFRQFMALDDDIIKASWGPRVASKYEQLGIASPGRCDRFRRVLRAAQAKIESLHYRQRRLLLYHEKERRKTQLQMGQDPYLDVTS